jgi:hypothetical protein
VAEIRGNPDAVLEAIDGALQDYSVSADAMRWVPESGSLAPRRAGHEFSVVIIDEVDWDAAEQAATEAFETFRRGMQKVAEAFAASMVALGPLEKIVHDMSAVIDPRDHRKCRTCHPQAFLTPAWSGGREYHRRLKARQRRKRR